MELTERVNQKNVRWLLASLSDDFLKQHVLDGEEERFNFSYVKKTLQSYKDGVRKAVYSKKDKFGILRDYAQGIQSLPTKFRGLLCKNMTDVDMVNAHPVILWNLCLKHRISCHYLEDYVKNRKTLIAEGKCSKMDIIRSINKKQPIKCDGWLKSFDNEMKQIQKQFFQMPEYEKQRILSETKPRNREGSFMSHLATTFEVQILHAVLPTNIEIGVLMFDGLMFYGDRPPGLLEEMSQKARDIGFEIQFSYKEHDHSLVVPDDWKDQDETDLYTMFKLKYEKDYNLSFIEKDVMYSYKVGGDIHFYNQGDCSQLFNNVLVGKQSFFVLWNKDPTKQTYHTVGVYPHDVECPDGVLNLWTGYAAEKLPESDADITPILNHFYTLLGSDAEFILDWFANMFQFPSSRSLLLVIQSEEGSGKSTIMDFIASIMGPCLAIEINDVKENLFGRFNSHLSKKVFLNINETSRHELMPSIEKLKSMITSPTITIEEKGQKKYTEQNLSHYVMTVNPENVLAIKRGSRRFFYSKASEVLIGNTEYFNELYEFIKRPKNQRAFYQFLMSRPVKRCLTIKDIPDSAVMEEMYDLNKDPIEDYLAEFTGERNSQENYNMYKRFLHDNGLKFELSKKAFETKVGKYRKQYGIEKAQKSIDGERYYVYSKVAPQLEADLLLLPRDAE